MPLKQSIKSALPPGLKNRLRPLVNPFLNKNREELDFWRSRLARDHGTFRNDHYAKIFLAMAGEADDSFLTGKIVADFGCGPRGSLVWARAAALRIGIDVLADAYADAFTDNVLSHDMIYLKSTEKVIPLPSDFVDVLFTLNAIDHVDNFPQSCRELLRILKPGGLLIASFNLNEPATACEPQTLTEPLIDQHLLNHLEVITRRVSRKGPPADLYAPFFNNTLSYQPGEEGILWVKAMKETGVHA